MDPTVQGAVIGASSALIGGGLTAGVQIYMETLRDKREVKRARENRVHQTLAERFQSRKEAYEEFYRVLTVAERECLEMEAQTGLLPGDQGYDEEYRALDAALASLQFVATDECLATAEECSRAFYTWAYSGGKHLDLFNAMNSFVASVRHDLDINVLGYVRPVPTARQPPPPKT